MIDSSVLSARAAMTTDHWLGDLTNKIYFLADLEEGVQDRVLAGLVSGDTSFQGLQRAACLLCSHVASPLCVHIPGGSPSSDKGTCAIGLGISLTLIISQKSYLQIVS